MRIVSSRASADAQRPRGARHIPPYHSPSLQDHPIRGALAPHRSASGGPHSCDPSPPRSHCARCPQPVVHSCRIRGSWNYSTASAAHGSFLSARLRSPGVHQGDSNLASHAPRRLEVAGSGHVVCQGRSDKEHPRIRGYYFI
jgi:hypothetical protein